MVFGKKKDTTPKTNVADTKNATTTATATPAKEEPKAPPKHDLAAKLREQKAQRDAEEKTKQLQENNKSVSETKKSPEQTVAKTDSDWDAKLKEIMRESGEDATKPKPKTQVVIKPDGTKVYKYHDAYSMAVSDDPVKNKAVSEDPVNNKNDTSANDAKQPTKKVPKSAPPAAPDDSDDMKGFDDFYKWVKNGQTADIPDCENVIFGKH